MRPFLEPLDEHERLAKNQPHPNIDKAYPKATDGTTSSIIRKTGRRIVQQIPTGRVHSDQNDWLSIVAGFIFSNRILPNANEQNAFIEKCWRLIRNALTYGAAHSNTPFVNRGDYFGTDLSLPYIKNVKFEAGKVSDLESNCEFLESWYQPADIDAIIKQQKSLAKKAKERGEKFDNSWDLKALEEIKELISAKTDEETNSNSAKKTEDATKDGVKLVHAFQRGIGSKFYTFHESSEKIVRTKLNKDPRGEIPLQTMYFETDGMNPLGTGIPEMVGSLQNLMDSEMQMYQFNRALMLAPPMIKRGSWNKTQAKLSPNVIIDLGTDPVASFDPIKIDSSAIANFPSNYGLMKSQLLNLTASPDTSISSDVGNPSFSKTPAGINVQQANVSVDDNYIRKQFESWFERWAETAINLYFAERTGIEELQLDKDTALKLRRLEEEGKLEQGFVSEEDKIVIDYDTATEVLKFEVDASTSNMKNDAQQLEALDGLLARLEKSQVLQGAIPPKKIIGAWNAIVASSGVENPEELSVSDEELEQMEQQREAAAYAEQQALEQAQMSPEMGEVSEQMPEEAPMPQDQPQDTSQEDLAFIAALQDMGYSDEQIQQALAMDQYGFSNEDIITVLEGSNSEAVNG